ncbi:glycosyltransferase family 2 protein [Novosphingobium profundi]|uniref:glycosyltransferase family 2 protein n=1 Tax=Novosphingobium profundi TaxID=1774954 RepID=UPI001BD9301D|nr:glycosyltransferase [Novosphingobium profundi]MBT0667938.1 glycosyltransferase family 2 protein [Novosphingobium profundi]
MMPALTDPLATTVLALAWICLLVVIARNAVSVVQLAIAAWYFVRRIRPSPRSIDLWSRCEGLAPPVSVIAPAFNEELSIVESVKALLALHYPEHEVIVVNDGSKDATLARMIEAFAMHPTDRQQVVALQHTRIRGVYASRQHPNLLLVDKENGRKADAANAGIGFAITPLVCVIDADSLIEPDGLLRATEPFMSDEGSLIAVGGAIRIVNGSRVRGGHIEAIGIAKEWLPRFQIVEYMRAFLTARVANAQIGILTLISGAFGIFRRELLVEIGGYRHDTVGEDLEIVTRLHRHMRENKRDYRIDFVPEIVCWTEAPATLAGLRNQRMRWQQGALETLVRHRAMLGNPRYGRIGLLALPLLVLEDVVGPPAELLGYLIFPIGFALGILDATTALAFLSLTFVFGTAISVATLALEEHQLRRTPTAADLMRVALAAVFENFGYRQANLVFRLRGIVRFFRGETAWAAVPRRGFSTDPAGKTAWPLAGDRRQPPDSAPAPLEESVPVRTETPDLARRS